MLKVSIIVSNFNYGEFLKPCLESALSQTYSPCEIIVVDDGSTDNSSGILAQYAERARIFKLDHQGETASRNFGFLQSTGDLICFLDADDMLQPDTAARVVQFWKPQFTKVQYHMRVVDRQGLDQHLLMPRCRLDSGNVSQSLLKSGRYITAPGTGNFYSRSLLEKITPVPASEWPQSFDSYAAAYAGFLGEIGAIQEPLAFYRVHDSNTSRAGNAETLETSRIDVLLERQLRLRALIQKIAAQLGLHADPGIVINHWLYLKLELAKRAHRPDAHLGEIFGILRRMFVSAVSAPELNLTRRTQLIAWSLGSSLLPERLSNHIMRMGFDLAPESSLARAMRRL